MRVLGAGEGASEREKEKKKKVGHAAVLVDIGHRPYWHTFTT